jgi:hypothetical protein
MLLHLAPKSVFILDESHNAGGESETGDFLRSVLPEARGVTYLSATYAKRPDNMPLYFKTDIGQAIQDSQTLMDAMTNGGLPLQTVVSNNLVKAGQMFRRERSYDGVSMVTKVDTAHRVEHTKLADAATTALRAIVAADRGFHEGYVVKAQKDAKKAAKSVKGGGNKASTSVQHSEFTAVVHNFVRQMLLGIKAETAASEALAALKRGEKPLIAVDNTMGSFLSAFVGDHGINVGDELENFDYRTVLSRALDRTRFVHITDPQGNETRVPVTLEELDEETRAKYDEAQKVIDTLDINLPVSPIDWIRMRLEEAGYSVSEITGRNLAVDYSDPEHPKLGQVPMTEQKDKVGTTRRFNDGRLDSIILNVSGSTGISLHASEKFTDQRPRHMIVVQPAQDINIFMQMLGRIHRTGQVKLPSYTILNADLPAEKRPSALLSKKMKSLNANTSSNTESATSIKAADMMNKYGDQIIGQYLSDNPELEDILNVEALDANGEPTRDIARKATGRLAILPVHVQDNFYRDVEQQYNDYINFLDQTNQNELEPRTFDYDAKELNSKVFVEGENKSSPFGEDAVYGEYLIKSQGKPLTAEEVDSEITRNLDGAKDGYKHAQALVSDLDKQFDGYIKTLDPANPNTGRARDVAEGTKRFIQNHRIGSTWRLEINGDIYNTAVTNIRSTHKGNGNPFSLSKINVTVAVNGPMRMISVPATQFQGLEVADTTIYATPKDVFGVVRSDMREEAKIITGNLLAAYGELGSTRGNIIHFTKADGTTEQGIQLPKRFEVKDHAQDYRMRSGQHVVKFLKKSSNPAIEKIGIQSRDGNVRIVNERDHLVMITPKSKARGGKYFLDPKITELTGDFVSQGNTMRVTLPRGKEAKVIDLVAKKAALYASPTMADEAKGMAPKNDNAYAMGNRGIKVGDDVTVSMGDIGEDGKVVGVEKSGNLQVSFGKGRVLEVDPSDVLHSNGLGWDKIDNAPDEISGEYQPPEGIHPPVITLSQSARALVNKIQGRNFLGLNTTKYVALNISQKLRQLQDVKPEDVDKVAALAGIFGKAGSEAGDSGVIVIADKKALPEENFHGIQRYVGKGAIEQHLTPEQVQRLSEHPIWGAMSNFLDENGYQGIPQWLRVAEAAAKIATIDPGPYMAGMSPEDAADFLVEYFHAIAETHGLEVLPKFSEKLAGFAKEIVEIARKAVESRQTNEPGQTPQGTEGSGGPDNQGSVEGSGEEGAGKPLSRPAGGDEEAIEARSAGESKPAQNAARVEPPAFKSDREPETTFGASVPLPTEAVKHAYDLEVKPFLENVGINLRQALDELKHLVAPRADVARPALDSVMKLTGERAKRAFVLDNVLDGAEKFFDKLPDQVSVDFIDNRKLGNEQDNAQLQQIADFIGKTDEQTYRALVDAQVETTSKRAQKLWAKMSEQEKVGFLHNIADFKEDEDIEDGPLKELAKALLSYKENHFRVLWKTIPGAVDADGNVVPGPERATPRQNARRPLQGSKGFLKQSTLDTMSEGLERGGEPVSYNPVTMFKLAQADAWRYITALKMWNDAKKQGARVFVKQGSPRPEGFDWIEDKIGNVKFPAESGEGLIEAGRWAMREDYARLLNNFLSEDWVRKFAIGKGLMAAKNQLTAWRLGFSPFHAIVTSVSAVSTQAATGLVHAFNQGVRHADWRAILEGGKAVATSLGAPYLLTKQGTSAVRFITTKSAFLNTLRGHDFLEQYPEADRLLDLAFAGGAKFALHEDERLKAIAGMRKAIKEERYLAALLKSPFAANQLLFGPLFDFYIPRAKLGAFLKEYSQRLVDYGPELRAGKTTPEEQARKVWDSVENVFGQMNWDARWWHRTFKAVIQLAFRAFTWFAGNIRLAGDAARGQGHEVWESAKYWNSKFNPESEFKPSQGTTGIPRLDFNFAKLIALAGTFVTANALIQLAMTGEGPKDMKDLMAARIGGEDYRGKPRRVTTPAIVFKDWLALQEEGPRAYLSAKSSDLLSGVADVWKNEDFRKVMVYNPDDPFWKKAYDSVEHVFGSPIGVSTFKKELAMGGSKASSALGLAGFGPPPRSYDWTPAEKKLNEILERDQVAHTQQEMDEFRARRDAVLAGDMGPKAMAKAMKELDTDWIVKMFKKVDYEQAVNVFDNFASPEEQQLLKPYLEKKRKSLTRRDPLKAEEVDSGR